MAKDEGVAFAADIGDPGGGEARADVILLTPGHRADEAFGRRRGERGAGLQNLRHQGRVAGDPIAHRDRTAGLGHPDHFPGDIVRTGCEHRTENGYDPIEAGVRDAGEVAGITLLEGEVVEPCGRGPGVSGCDEICGNIDPQHVRAAISRRKRRSAVAAAKVEQLFPGSHADTVDQFLAALPHGIRNPGEVALFPQRFVGIHRRLHPLASGRANNAPMNAANAVREVLSKRRR